MASKSVWTHDDVFAILCDRIVTAAARKGRFCGVPSAGVLPVKIAKSRCLVASIILCHGMSLQAASDSSSGGSWLPFSSSASKPVKTKKVSSTGSTPSAVTNLSKGTKQIVTSTKNVLTPKKPQSVRKSGTTGGQIAKNPKPADKPGFFKSMFHPEPPPPPKTIKEWMSLKQVHP
jgi:hypothetical protein